MDFFECKSLEVEKNSQNNLKKKKKKPTCYSLKPNRNLKELVLEELRYQSISYFSKSKYLI